MLEQSGDRGELCHLLFSYSFIPNTESHVQLGNHAIHERHPIGLNFNFVWYLVQDLGLLFLTIENIASLCLRLDADFATVPPVPTHPPLPHSISLCSDYTIPPDELPYIEEGFDTSYRAHSRRAPAE